jgi:hypothetical protein
MIRNAVEARTKLLSYEVGPKIAIAIIVSVAKL